MKTKVEQKKRMRQRGNAQGRRLRRKRWERERARIERRLSDAKEAGDLGRPLLGKLPAKFEVSQRERAIAHGGISAVHQVVMSTDLVKRLNEKVEVLKVHRPYHESDHVLNIAYNAVCGGTTLDDIELRRNDTAFLDALGVPSLPDPTTAGDFCRRFDEASIASLQEAINETRLEVWNRQPPAFTKETARIDADGSMVGTKGECKEGMALSYKGTWGYHPLLVSLANTAEPLFIVNRSGNRPSSEGAAEYLDKAVTLCRRAGFEDILLRGDTDFSQTTELDRWDGDGVRFVFGYDASKPMKRRADAQPEEAFVHLERRAAEAFAEKERRARPERHKENFVREKGYTNIKLRSEDVADFDYRPTKCKRTYRMVVLRKNLTVMKGDTALFDDHRYFFYITNDRNLSNAEVVREANQRCNQENLIEQLKNGVRALHAPVNTLLANGAYMVMTALAWSLKAWTALSLPVAPRWASRHEADQQRWLRMDFRTFRNRVIDMPAQILRSGRRLIYRFICWRPEQPTFFRLLDSL